MRLRMRFFSCKTKKINLIRFVRINAIVVREFVIVSVGHALDLKEFLYLRQIIIHGRLLCIHGVIYTNETKKTSGKQEI